jgi:hypothetical protein
MNRLLLISPEQGEAFNQFFLVMGNWELGIGNEKLGASQFCICPTFRTSNCNM